MLSSVNDVVDLRVKSYHTYFIMMRNFSDRPTQFAWGMSQKFHIKPKYLSAGFWSWLMFLGRCHRISAIATPEKPRQLTATNPHEPCAKIRQFGFIVLNNSTVRVY